MRLRRNRRDLFGGEPCDFVRYGSEFTRFLHAFQAADAIRLVGPLVKPYTHGTVVVTLFTENALVGVMYHPEDADFVEKGIDSAQGANDSAERSSDQYHQHQEKNQDNHLIEI